MEGIAGPIDDRLQQLVPGARRRGQPGDVVDEPQLVELAALTGRRLRLRRRRRARTPRPVLHAGSSSCHVNHLTRVGMVAPGKGCGPVIARLRYRPRRVPG
jgi:hypothetical protein